MAVAIRSVAEGDIVRVDDGRPYLAEIVSIERRRLHVQPLMLGRPTLAPRTVRAAWISAWWKRMDQRGGPR